MITTLPCYIQENLLSACMFKATVLNFGKCAQLSIAQHVPHNSERSEYLCSACAEVTRGQSGGEKESTD